MKKDLTSAQAAARLGVTKKAIANWVKRGVFPNAYKLNPLLLNSHLRIPEQDIEAFEQMRKEGIPSEAA